MQLLLQVRIQLGQLRGAEQRLAADVVHALQRRDAARLVALEVGTPRVIVDQQCAGDLRAHIAGLTPARASYLIKRLRTHGLIKKVAHTYNYFFTKLGRRVFVTALVIREYFVQPTLVRAAI